MPDISDRILALIADGTSDTQPAIAARLGISERTLRRHLRRLVTEHLATERRIGSRKSYALGPLGDTLQSLPLLMEAEVEALTIAALAARGTLAPTPLGRYLQTATEKLQRTWVDDVFSFEPEYESERWDFGGNPDQPFDTDHFRTLVEAIRGSYEVQVDYFTASRQKLTTGRRLWPLGVLVRKGSWMIAAAEPDSALVKDFALRGFRKVEAHPAAVFDMPRGFSLHAHAGRRFGALASGGEHTVRLEVSHEALPYFDRKAYHASQRITRQGNGSAEATLTVEGLDDICAWILSWGDKVRVLEPAHLAARVRDAHRAAADLYSSAVTRSGLPS